MRPRALILVAVLAVTGCESAPPPDDPVISCAAGTVRGQGSPAQTNAVHAWIEEYQIACAGAAVSYRSVGSGAGVRAFLTGEGDFAGTDAPLSAADQAAADARCGAEAVHLPLVVGPIALAYNVVGVQDLMLSAGTVARIFSGEVVRWDDPVIAADNAGVVLPATRIRPVHRSDSSGTTFNFTKYLSTSPLWAFGVASDWPAPGGTGVRGSHRVAEAIARTEGAIGYVESSYARVNDLPVAWLGDAARGFAAPTDYATGEAVASARVGDDLHVEVDPPAGTYPLLTITYEVVCRTGTPAVARSFLAYAAGPSGQRAVSYAGYVPLPEPLRLRVEQVVASLR